MLKAHDQSLFDMLNTLTKEAIEILSRKRRKIIPKKPIFFLSHRTCTDPIIREEYERDYQQFVCQSMVEIRDLPAFQNFSGYLLNNQTIVNKSVSYELIKYDQPPYPMVFRFLFAPFIGDFLSAVKGIKYSEKDFQRKYQELEDFIFKAVDSYTITSPIANFYGETDNINLDNDLRIKLLTADEKNGFLRTKHAPHSFVNPLDGFNILNYQYALETTYHYIKSQPFDINFGRQLFEEVVTALRLFKKGSVDFSCIRYLSKSWQPVLQEQYGETNNPEFDEKMKYSLTEEEAVSFKEFWQFFKLNYAESPSYIKIAIKRFNLAVEENELADKVMDFAISLEALYLENNPELGFRLSNRVAVLLCKSDQESIALRDFIGDVYGLRSSIAHGAENSKECTKIMKKYGSKEALLERLEQQVRQSIIAFLVLSKFHSKKGIMELLDSSLLNMKDKEKLQSLVNC